jgi:diguanylate cyclase (GGDEF)-like protein
VDAHDYVDTASRALVDELTKAYSRRFFDEEFRRLFLRARAGGSFFSMLMLDLDNFKIYNDANGHIQGDIALIETVRILHAVCSQEATVCRYGGEEFAILLPGEQLEAAARTAENIRQAVYDYRFVNEQALPGGRLSVSLGITVYRDEIQEPQQMIEEADAALYRAKNEGRNRVMVNRTAGAL